MTPAADVYALGVVLYEMVTGTWPFVGENPLKVAIKRLHEAPTSPRVHVPDLDPLWEATILRCLARRPEERFASAGEVVSALEEKLVEPAAAPARRQQWTGAIWSALAVVILATLAAGYVLYARYTGASGPAGITSIAVLPFRNTSNDPEQDYVSDGISEGLINRLSQVHGLKVVANSSSSRYKGQDADPREVARALDVAGILVGRVSQRGDSLSISVELIDGRDRSQVWGSNTLGKQPTCHMCRRRSLATLQRSCRAGRRASSKVRDARDAEPRRVRIAAQGAFPSRQGWDGGPAESG